jgi:hypothetical protein
MVRGSTLLAPSQELAARAQPMSRPFSFLLFFSFDFAFASKTFHAFSGILVPSHGTIHGARMVPSTKPAPNTSSK